MFPHRPLDAPPPTDLRLAPRDWFFFFFGFFACIILGVPHLSFPFHITDFVCPRPFRTLPVCSVKVFPSFVVERVSGRGKAFLFLSPKWFFLHGRLLGIWIWSVPNPPFLPRFDPICKTNLRRWPSPSPRGCKTNQTPGSGAIPPPFSCSRVFS